MTNTLTSDVKATITQVKALEEAGATSCASRCRTSLDRGAEIHRARDPCAHRRRHSFHYKRAIEAAQAGAACLRINPGNIGSPRA